MNERRRTHPFLNIFHTDNVVTAQQQQVQKRISLLYVRFFMSLTPFYTVCRAYKVCEAMM